MARYGPPPSIVIAAACLLLATGCTASRSLKGGRDWAPTIKDLVDRAIAESPLTKRQNAGIIYAMAWGNNMPLSNGGAGNPSYQFEDNFKVAIQPTETTIDGKNFKYVAFISGKFDKCHTNVWGADEWWFRYDSLTVCKTISGDDIECNIEGPERCKVLWGAFAGAPVGPG